MDQITRIRSPAQEEERVRYRRERPVKLIIQIPCYNEQDTLAQTLGELPREVPGVDLVEWLVVNDGSQDRTIEVARASGVDHIVDLGDHVGLAGAFMAGLARAIELGADIIVNTDADNQYHARDIPRLVAPILSREADVVVGDRPISRIEQFSWAKRKLQALGSRVVRMVSGTSIRDAPSGFRALSRDAALRINVFDPFTYTLETIIEAGLSGMKTTSVPVRVNGRTRSSRLVRSTGGYVLRSITTIAHALFIYRPARVLFLIGLPLVATGALLVGRWLWLFGTGSDRAHAPSLIMAALSIMLGALAWCAGLLGELAAINRRLLQDIQYMLRRDGGGSGHRVSGHRVSGGSEGPPP